MTYPTGTVLTMTCDAANRVTSVRLGGDAVATDVTYHPAGHPSAVTYGNGVSTDFGIDDRGRVASVTAPGVLDLRYGYDGADNVTSIEDLEDPASPRSMTYDAADRLATVIANGLWGYALYQYDELGNRTLKYMGTDVYYGYDDSNRLVSSSEVPDRGTLIFTWDDEGRLASSSDGVSYRYDGQGRRVAKAEAAQTTVFHYDPSGRVIAETLPDGTKLRHYVYLAGRLVAVDGCVSSNMPPCNERQWYHTDTLGSAVARTDVSGAVVARLEYSPWGQEWAYQGEPGDRQYNGRVYDAGTGFHDYGARMYWPEIGRFISADSSSGDIASPVSLNRYAYVHDNPYKFVDPDGHQAVNPGRLARPPSQVDWAARGRVVREAIAEGRIEARGQAYDTIGPQGEPPSEAAVRHAERTADAVNPRPVPLIINPQTGLPLGLTKEDVARIQNAANRIGKPITLVGSRAAGTAREDSDWDYVIEANNHQRASAAGSLPGAKDSHGTPRNQDVFKGPVDTSRPHVTFPPNKP